MRIVSLIVAVLMAALSPVLNAFHRWMIAEPRPRTSILLRKVKGVRGAAAMFRANRLSFAGGLGMVGSLVVTASFMFVALVAAGALLFALHGPHTAYASGLAMANGGLAIRLKEVEGKISDRQAKVTKAFEHAGDATDFSKPDALKELGATDSKDAVVKLRAINAELTDLSKEREELKELAGLEEAKNRWGSEPVNNLPHPTGKDDLKERRAQKSLGQVFVDSKVIEQSRKAGRQTVSMESEDFGLKTLMSTSAGFAPESTRSGVVIDKTTRPIQLLDMIPSGPTDQAAYIYMEETTRTHNAAERAEAGSYAEDAFAFTQRSETVRSIGTSLPVTDEQLEDVAGISTFIDGRLTFSARQRLDNQILLGDGNAPNLTGIANKASIQTQAKSTDPVADAFLKGMTKVRVTGRALPNLGIIHPTDWQGVRLTRTADGLYIWGNPSEAGPERMWGMQIVQCDAGSAGTGYVVDTSFMSLFERKGATIEVGYVNTNFTDGKKTIRVTVRVAFVIYRAAAICSVTGL